MLFTVKFPATFFSLICETIQAFILTLSEGRPVKGCLENCPLPVRVRVRVSVGVRIRVGGNFPWGNCARTKLKLVVSRNSLYTVF